MTATQSVPDPQGRFGPYGGRYVPETLMYALRQLTEHYDHARTDPEFRKQFDYYKQLGRATPLPLFVQSTGNMSVDLIVEMFKSVPTMRVVKDEAGSPLERVGELRRKTSDRLAVFSGNGVRTMIDEMRLGFLGHCPTTGLADVYAQAFDLWHAGKKREAFDMFGRVLAFSSIGGSQNYVLVARGVFKETTRARGRGTPPLDDEAKKAIREALAVYLKPYLRA